MEANFVHSRQQTRYVLIKLTASVLTVVAIVARPYLPEKRLPLLERAATSTVLYSDETWGGLSSAVWVDEDQNHWLCRLLQSQFYPVCGYSISFLQGDLDSRADNYAKNFSRFDAIELTIHYRGEAPNLRVYMRNHNPAYSDVNDDDSYKFNAFSVSTEDLQNGPTTIKLTEFSVANWWLEERQIPRTLSAPEFDKVVALGIDLPAPHVFGQHDVRIERIDLIGQYIQAQTLYLSLLIAWVLAAIVESIFTFKNQQRSRNKQPLEQKPTE